MARIHDRNAENLGAEIQNLFSNCDETETALANPDMHHSGGLRQRDRLVGLADLCARKYAGDMVEIGAHVGETSVRLAEVAVRHKRRLIVIDPWLSGSQDCEGDEYEMFLERIQPYQQSVDIWRASSMEPDILRRLRLRPLCFGFVDGWHIMKACYSDIMACGHTAGVISVDDSRYNLDLQFISRVAAKKLGRLFVQDPYQRECHLIPDSLLQK
ncbi:MAG: hypothetical protein HC904_04640 [Blastochloris sp.]|nr:hypothetical protein [Blastochloris sp.]